MSYPMNGTGRPVSRRSGASRFAPRGMLSTSHRPMGLADRESSFQNSAGTTMNDLLTPIR